MTDEYWILKNSWGTSWGIGGYIHVIRDNGKDCGIGNSVHMLNEVNLMFALCLCLILIFI